MYYRGIQWNPSNVDTLGDLVLYRALHQIPKGSTIGEVPLYSALTS